MKSITRYYETRDYFAYLSAICRLCTKNGRIFIRLLIRFINLTTNINATDNFATRQKAKPTLPKQ